MDSLQPDESRPTQAFETLLKPSFLYSPRKLIISKPVISYGKRSLQTQEIVALKWVTVRSLQFIIPSGFQYHIYLKDVHGKRVTITFTSPKIALVDKASNLALFESILHALDQHVTYRIKTKLLESINEGGSVELFRMQLSQEKITYKTLSLPYSEIESAFTNGFLELKERGKKRPFKKVPLQTAWNWPVLHQLLTELRSE